MDIILGIARDQSTWVCEAFESNEREQNKEGELEGKIERKEE